MERHIYSLTASSKKIQVKHVSLVQSGHHLVNVTCYHHDVADVKQHSFSHLLRKLYFEQHEPHTKRDAPEG